MEEGRLIWLDGKLVEWHDAKVHLLSHTLEYGGGAYDGLRCYRTDGGPAIFRLDDHVDRVFNSALVNGIKIPYTRAEFKGAIVETVKANAFDDCYIRPIVFIGYGGDMGLDYREKPVSAAVAVWPWGSYLGDELLDRGARVKVSSYTSHHPNIWMTKASLCGTYVLHAMATVEARRAGYDEALLLDANGNVAEGPVESIFAVKRGLLKAPSTTAIFPGITRDTILCLAGDLGIPAREQDFPRDELYISDEAFFCGTAAQVTPVREVDDVPIGTGEPGPITRRLQRAFFDTVRGRVPDRRGWLTCL